MHGCGTETDACRSLLQDGDDACRTQLQTCSLLGTPSAEGDEQERTELSKLEWSRTSSKLRKTSDACEAKKGGCSDLGRPPRGVGHWRPHRSFHRSRPQFGTDPPVSPKRCLALAQMVGSDAKVFVFVPQKSRLLRDNTGPISEVCARVGRR